MCFEVKKLKKFNSIIFAIVLSATLLLGTTVSYGATNPIPSPREQMDSGISASNVVCKAGLTLIVRANTDAAACVKKSSTDQLVQKGWAVKLATFLEKKPQLSGIGDVKMVKIVPVFVDKNRLDTNPKIVKNYNYVFEACAKNNLIRAPQVLITSDSETKSVNLSENIQPKTCQMTSTVIKATDLSSIKASLVKKADISLIVSELESKVADLQNRLAVEKKALSDLAKQISPTADSTKKISETTDKIITLRNELNAARADLQKNQYALMVGVKASPVIQPAPQTSESATNSNATTNYPYVNKIKTVAQYSDSGRLNSKPLISSSFNFVFEACAGKDSILYPEVMVRSDTEVKSIKLSESIDARACQTSSTVIKAADSNTIVGTIITSGDISMMIKELETKVASIQESITMDKNALSSLLKQTPAPENFSQKITELTDKITQQRNELNQAKHDLISLKYMVN